MTEEPTTEELKRAALDTIAHGVQDYIQASHPNDDAVYVSSWLVSAEWTSIALEQSSTPGLAFIAPLSQGLVVARGLSELAAERASLFSSDYDLNDDDDDDGED